MTTPHLGEETAQALVDGALSDGETAAAQAHLSTCSGCRLRVESYRALADALEGLEAPPPPPDFTRAVMERIDAIEHARAAERWIAGGILGGAVVLSALLAVLAGDDTWAAVTAALATALAGVGRTLAVVADVASPVFRALRLQITLACCVVAIPLLLSFWRLLPRAREVAVRS